MVSVTFHVYFVYIVYFSRPHFFFVTLCSASRSVFIGRLDCQSSFWCHDVLPICWGASCIWGLEMIVVCVRHASIPCAPTRSAVSCPRKMSLDAQCILSSKSYVLCCVIWSIYRFDLWLLTCIEFFVKNDADVRVGSFSLITCQVQR